MDTKPRAYGRIQEQASRTQQGAPEVGLHAPALTTPKEIERWLDAGRLWDAERLAKESM